MLIFVRKSQSLSCFFYTFFFSLIWEDTDFSIKMFSRASMRWIVSGMLSVGLGLIIVTFGQFLRNLMDKND